MVWSLSMFGKHAVHDLADTQRRQHDGEKRTQDENVTRFAERPDQHDRGDEYTDAGADESTDKTLACAGGLGSVRVRQVGVARGPLRSAGRSNVGPGDFLSAAVTPTRGQFSKRCGGITARTAQ